MEASAELLELIEEDEAGLNLLDDGLAEEERAWVYPVAEALARAVDDGV